MKRSIVITLLITATISAISFWLFKDKYHRHIWNTEEIPQAEHFKVDPSLPMLEWEIVAEYPHRREAFTQGLTYRNGLLYEGTGNYGRSEISVADFSSYSILHARKLDPKYFGEGITLKEDELYQLSWKEKTLFVYQADSLKLLRSLSYEGDGWGLAWNGAQFLMTNGSEMLQIRSANDFSLQKEVLIQDGVGPISKLNELEWVNGKLWANIWGTDYAVILDSETGIIEAAVDFKALKYQMKGRAFANVLNGIAYREDTDTFLITGKNWTRVFEIRIKTPY